MNIPRASYSVALLSLLLCGTVLTGCAQQGSNRFVRVDGKAQAASKTDITAKPQTDIAGNPLDAAPAQAPAIIPQDPNVTVYPLEGPVQNPLVSERYRGVLDNTTSGGYTVFDPSVTVYPLAGNEPPAYVPGYAVPPLQGEPNSVPPKSTLPPVPTVDVSEADPSARPPVPGIVRTPVSMTRPDFAPVTLQPPSAAKPDFASPFDPSASAPVPRGPAGGNSTNAMTPKGGKSRKPMLTGY